MHILWKESKDEFFSKGKTFEAETPLEAYQNWQLWAVTEYGLKTTHIVFMAMYVIE